MQPRQFSTKSSKKHWLKSPARRAALTRSFQAKAPPPILQLQRILGNRRLAQLIRAKRITPQGKIIGIQRKLTVGAANDQYEQEADYVARQVMSMSESAMPDSHGEVPTEEDKDKVLQTKSLANSITPFVQRALENRGKAEDKEEEMPVQAGRIEEGVALQRQPQAEEEEEQDSIRTQSIQTKTESKTDSFEAGADVESRLDRSKGGGSALPDSVRGYMEPRFGLDFGHVRVHTGSEAIQMNHDLGAKAFTHGSDIYYGASQHPGDYELTAHELTHVVQQTEPARPKRTAQTDNSNPVMRACPTCTQENKEKEESALKTFTVQRTIGDGHDFPPVSQFSGNVILEGVFDNQRVLETGSSGAAVTLVQQVLVNLGYQLPRFGVDGEFGDETRRAVDAFQRDVGLGPDGRVGFRTIDFLDKRDRGAEVAPPARPVIANAPFNLANAIAQPGATPSNALGAGVWGLTFPENIQVTIDVFNNAGVWQSVLTGVTGNYSMQTRLLPGVTEVTGPAGNTIAGNYCPQINDLDSLGAPGSVWYMLSAVLAHERVHARQFRTALIHPSVIAPLEAAIEAITTPVSILTPTPGFAEFFIRLDPAFAAALNAAQANWLARILILVANDHLAGGATDTEEHAIVDPMRRRICRHARANGWPACPPLCP